MSSPNARPRTTFAASSTDKQQAVDAENPDDRCGGQSGVPAATKVSIEEEGKERNADDGGEQNCGGQLGVFLTVDRPRPIGDWVKPETPTGTVAFHCAPV
jgi:hypothetical protein